MSFETASKSILVRLVRSPYTVSILLSDRLVIPFWVRLNGVRFGHHCRFVGCPIIKLAPGSKINLGHNVLVNSRVNSNPAGLPYPTILATLAPQSCIEVGNGAGISGASIVARCAINIGKRVLVGAGACIWDTDFHPINADQRCEHPTCDAKYAPINIGDDVFIGARAMILKGVNIGPRAVIGAGAIVTKDVNPGDVVAGNPARVIGSETQDQEESSYYENAGNRF